MRVTDDLVLPKVITNQNRLPNTFSTDLPPLFLIIIIASAALAGLLIILAVVMVRKCKRKSKVGLNACACFDYLIMLMPILKMFALSTVLTFLTA